MSLPMRECGLKLMPSVYYLNGRFVTPHAGVWIETTTTEININGNNVTPHAGVWIETVGKVLYDVYYKSLPMRECGLKQSFRR